MFEKTDSYGAYIDVELIEGAKNIGFLVMDITKGDAGKDGGDKSFTVTSPEINEIFIKQGDDKVYKYEPVNLPENTVRVHYVRDNADYENFGSMVLGGCNMLLLQTGLQEPLPSKYRPLWCVCRY